MSLLSKHLWNPTFIGLGLWNHNCSLRSWFFLPIWIKSLHRNGCRATKSVSAHFTAALFPDISINLTALNYTPVFPPTCTEAQWSVKAVVLLMLLLILGSSDHWNELYNYVQQCFTWCMHVFLSLYLKDSMMREDLLHAFYDNSQRFGD